jgi:hypothetical protein
MINRGLIGKAIKAIQKYMVGFEFASIDYGEKLFEAVDGKEGEKDRNVMDNLAKRCEVVYAWPGPDGNLKRLPGVICVRDVSGKGEPKFLDTSHSASSGRGAMCAHCTWVARDPVYHGEDPCEPDVGSVDGTQPSLLRLIESGAQRNPRVQNTSARTEYTVPDLKMLLKAHGLSLAGTKPALIQRLKDHENTTIVEAVEVGNESNDDEGDSDLSEPESVPPSYSVERVEGLRIVRNQLQHRVYWEEGNTTWETSADSVRRTGWVLRPPFNTMDTLQALFDENVVTESKKQGGGRKRAMKVALVRVEGIHRFGNSVQHKVFWKGASMSSSWEMSPTSAMYGRKIAPPYNTYDSVETLFELNLQQALVSEQDE